MIKSAGSTRGRGIKGALKAIVLAGLMLSVSSCALTDSDDYIYLYILHGYAGGGSVAAYGPSGSIASGLEFGELSEVVKIDRSRYQGTIDLALDGVPGLVPIQVPLFDLYPREAATLVVQRRTGNTTLETRLLRHHLIGVDAASPSFYKCATQVTNALSVSNAETDNRYDFATEWKFTVQEARFVYNDQVEQNINTNCGPVSVQDVSDLLGPIQDPVDLTRPPVNLIPSRQQQLESMREDQNLWLMMVQAEPLRPEEGPLTFRYSRWLSEGTSVVGVRSSLEFVECLAGAVSIAQDETSQGGENEEECEIVNGVKTVPVGPDGKPRINVEALTALECLGFNTYDAVTYSPAAADSFTVFYNPESYGATECERTIRLRTKRVDSIFDPPAAHLAKLVTIAMNAKRATWQHVVVYGRPIAPVIHQFTSNDLALTFEGEEGDYPGGLFPPEGERNAANQFRIVNNDGALAPGL